MSAIDVGLIGLGGHGRTIQNAVAACDALRVAAVFDPDQAESSASAERFGLTASADVDQLLATAGLRAAVIASPNRFHLDQGLAAVDAGLDLFMEKPIANTVADGKRLVDAALEAGRILMVGHNMRYSRSIQQARTLIEEGELGEIVTCELHFSADNAHRLDASAWRLNPEECPLLPVMQLGIHGIDILHHLVGPIAEISGYARSVATPAGVPDSVTGTFRFESGVLGTIVSNYCTAVGFRFQIVGTHGSLFATPHRIRLEKSADTDWHGEARGRDFDFLEYDMESYDRQMEDFAQHLSQKTQPENDGASALLALAVVEALHESTQTGQPTAVRVPGINDEKDLN